MTRSSEKRLRYMLWSKRLTRSSFQLDWVCGASQLRKAASRRLAEAGATPLEMAAVIGHTTLKETARYSAEANWETMADNAMRKLKTRQKREQKRQI